jgi:ubiquinone biosynthesis protein UbiJ
MSVFDSVDGQPQRNSMKSVHAPTMFPLLLRRAESLLNRWISESSAANQQMQDLEGRSMIVDVDKTSLRVRLAIDQQQARLRTAPLDARADIVIVAGVFDLLAMLHAQTLAELSAGEIEFRGSLAIAERFSRMLRLARPQLEDELAGWFGATPAKVLVRSGEALRDWGSRTADAMEKNVAEYLQAESAEVPRPEEVTQWSIAVERMRDDVDRLGQRIRRLQSAQHRSKAVP